MRGGRRTRAEIERDVWIGWLLDDLATYIYTGSRDARLFGSFFLCWASVSLISVYRIVSFLVCSSER